MPEPTGHDQPAERQPEVSRCRAALEVALETLVMSGREFTADDVWPLVDEDTRKNAPVNMLPSLFAGAVTAGRIERVGYETSTRPSRHGGLFRRWRAAA